MSTNVALDSIGQIHISVRDLPRAVGFYRDILGMRLLFEVPGQSMAFFDCGGIRLYLGRPESEEFRSNPMIYYSVASISEAHDALRARGVEFRSTPHIVHSTDTTELWMADLRDPDGNCVCIMSEVAK
jgi:catechol 2,3-dioxygenase-like lactoylglutathione lyase family enzyme